MGEREEKRRKERSEGRKEGRRKEGKDRRTGKWNKRKK